jgi:hypothetical protein
MHTHTSHRSLDSVLTVGELVALSKERGLDGICLTEHNSVWEPRKLDQIRKTYEFPIFSGMEVGTEKGHVLVFGLEQFELDFLYLSKLREAVVRAGAAMILAHPQRERSLPVGWSQLPSLFHGVETLNGSDANEANGYLASMALDVGLPGVGGSDAHSEGAVGSCATLYETPIHTDADLVRELPAGRFKAVDLRLSPQANP